VAANPFTVRTVFNRLPNLAGEMKSAGAALVAETARKIAADAAQRAPVRTGALRDSIRVEGAGSSSTVVAGVPYAVYVEYGTSRMGAQPFFWPALEANRPVYLAAWKAILAGTGRRAGSATVSPGRGTIRRVTGGRLPR
jgi:HK97 gp10 family phage protein